MKREDRPEMSRVYRPPIMMMLFACGALVGCAPTMPERTGDAQTDFRRVVAYCQDKVNSEPLPGYFATPTHLRFEAYVADDKGTVNMFGTDKQRFLFEKCMAEVKEKWGGGK